MYFSGFDMRNIRPGAWLLSTNHVQPLNKWWESNDAEQQHPQMGLVIRVGQCSDGCVTACSVCLTDKQRERHSKGKM